MPAEPVTQPATDQEIPFAHLISSETVNDTEAIGCSQILIRLWELANISHEVTRGSITGQIKALSMIVAIEGLIPKRHYSLHARLQSTRAFVSEAMRQQPQAEPTAAAKTVTPVASKPAAPSVPQPAESAPFLNSKTKSWMPEATDLIYDVPINPNYSLKLPLNTRGNGSAGSR